MAHNLLCANPPDCLPVPTLPTVLAAKPSLEDGVAKEKKVEVNRRGLWCVPKSCQEAPLPLALPFFLNGTEIRGLERQQLPGDLKMGPRIGMAAKKGGRGPWILGAFVEHDTSPGLPTCGLTLGCRGQSSVIGSPMQMQAGPARKGLLY